MNEANEHDWDQMVDGLRAGDPLACNEFWTRYGAVMQGIAERQLSGHLRRRVGSEDVVQSACRTFFRRVSAGQFDLPDADALWRLMCSITLTKARRMARDHGRQKRGVQSERYIDDRAGEDESSGGERIQLTGNQPSPLEVAAFSEQMQLLLAELSPQECQVLDLKLQNCTHDEIAGQIGCSERTVRRLVTQIKERWTAQAGEST